MRLRRFGIGWLMAVVAIVALNFGVVRAAYHRSGPRNVPTPINTRNKVEFWVRGGLPMANILATGLLIGLRRRTRHPALVGFEVSGAAAAVLYTVAVNYVCERHYLRYSDIVPGFLRSNHVACQVAASIILVSPQLALGVLGGFLTHQIADAARPDPGDPRGVGGL